MFDLSELLPLWGRPEFEHHFKAVVRGLDPYALPLQAALTRGSQALGDPVEAVVLSRRETETALIVHAGLFFESLIAGCNCADDPTPQDTLNEYCEAEFIIQRADGRTQIRLL